MKLFGSLVLVLVVIKLIGVSSVAAYYNQNPASVVIGQQNFTATSANQGISPNSNTLSAPTGVFYDPVSKKLFISELNNNRVLIFNKVPTTNNASADVVVGQQNFTSTSANQGGTANSNTLNRPTKMLVVNGRLIIADSSNQRVLIYNSIPTSNNASADVVIGQANFTSTSANQGGTVGTNGLRGLNTAGELGLASDGQRLAIADTGNNRVLLYNTIPTTSNPAPDVVLGQSTFFTGTGNQGGINSNTHNAPIGLAFVNGKLLAGDVGNFRILIWNKIPTTNKAPADMVIGQANFTSSGNPGGSAGVINVRRPFSIATDGQRLFLVHDFSAVISIRNYGVPTSFLQPSDILIGVTGGAIGASTFSQPRDVSVGDNMMFIADMDNSRVLIFRNVVAPPGVSLNGPPASADNNKLQVTGMASTISTYSVNQVQYSVNESGWANASAAEGNFDSATEGFRFNFDPTTNQPRDASNNAIPGYTLKIRSINTNNDTDTLFYFSPFNLNAPDDVSFTNTPTPTFTFSVNGQLAVMTTNLQKYQVMVQRTDSGEGGWQTIIDDLPINFNTGKSNPQNVQASQYAGQSTNNGVYETSSYLATYSAESSTIAVYPKTGLASGIYEWKVVAVDKNGHIQETPARTLYLNTSPQDVFQTAFPLTLSNLTGFGNLNVSTYYLAGLRKSYAVSTNTPTFGGIAFANSTVKVAFLDQACALKNATNLTTCLQTASATTGPDSRYRLSVPRGLLQNGKRYTTRLSVTQDSNYNQLPVFTLLP